MTYNDKQVILERLLQVWMVYPELRLGQLLSNAVYKDDDLFYISNNKLLDRLQELAEKYGSEPESE